MNNFDLKKYLSENKLTSNSKILQEGLGNIGYNLFKGKDSLQNRSKATPEMVAKLAQISKEKGLNVDKSGNWAWEEGNDKWDWNYDNGYLYYGDEYRDIIDNL